ncbi:hypothetical protein F5Y19DRAFT_493294 [Xylariaceae sp. FL1651]|nr:hypothetical protein F5Y19DRAFT_493294 [Xylariaceae sp. FL1651]
MTTTLPDSLFAALGDLRVKYAGSEITQNLVLMRTYPSPFSNTRATQAPSYTANIKFNTNFDAAVVILRHLYHTVAIRFRGDKKETLKELCEDLEKEERDHPLLRFIWADFEDTSDAAVAAQAILRYEMQKADDPEGRATVSSLLENGAMPQGVEKWKVIPHGDSIGEDGLVRWDGSLPLGQHIGDMFGIYIDKAQGHKFRYSFNYPAVIRVRYAHTNKSKPPAMYKDLSRIEICTHKLVDESDGDKVILTECNKELMTYTLVAVVRCSNDQSREADRIRLYDVIGNPLSLPMTMKDYTGTYWNLGDPNCVFMLFYAQALARPITGQRGGPVAYKVPNTKAIMKEMRASLNPIVKAEEPSA